jgi:hypothetical protein
MRRELDAAEVAKRLAALAASYVPETVQEGRARLREEAMAKDAFADYVQRRLEELRALDDMTRYLHAALPAAALRRRSGDGER